MVEQLWKQKFITTYGGDIITKNFLGVCAELRKYAKQFDKQEIEIALVGGFGVGKTVLTYRYAYDNLYGYGIGISDT
jgi:DNA replication protein DnaC